jgi:hypothetical protein
MLRQGNALGKYSRVQTIDELEKYNSFEVIAMLVRQTEVDWEVFDR